MSENKEEPKSFVYIGIGPHWVKCGRVFGSNYVLLGIDNIIVHDIKEAKCVVCGKKANTEDCGDRDC